MHYRAVLFDVDGTLVDSNDSHAQAWVEALAESGRRVDVARVRPLVGMGSDKVLPALSGIDAESDDGKRIIERRKEIFLGGYLPRLRATRGARQLLEHLKQQGLRLIIATSASPKELNGLLDVAGARDMIDDASSSGDADRSKPDPDIVDAALEKAGCAPHEAIFVGDTPYDISAGNRAGVRVIALRCGGWWTDRSFGGAVAIYDDPQDLLDHFDVTPFVRPLALSR
jgi:phosphoglycolate phosphatase-like HAD superfamily hydrolase